MLEESKIFVGNNIQFVPHTKHVECIVEQITEKITRFRDKEFRSVSESGESEIDTWLEWEPNSWAY